MSLRFRRYVITETVGPFPDRFCRSSIIIPRGPGRSLSKLSTVSRRVQVRVTCGLGDDAFWTFQGTSVREGRRRHEDLHGVQWQWGDDGAFHRWRDSERLDRKRLGHWPFLLHNNRLGRLGFGHRFLLLFDCYNLLEVLLFDRTTRHEGRCVRIWDRVDVRTIQRR